MLRFLGMTPLAVARSEHGSYILATMRIRLSVLSLVSLLVACEKTPAPPAAAAPRFVPVADVKQVMNAILEPAADAYWDAVGSIEDEKGTTEIAPKTPEEWDALVKHAIVITESGNLLMMDPRARDHAEWIERSRELVEAGRGALRAAESHKPSEVFDAGATLYEACTRCHSTYIAGQSAPKKKSSE